MAAFSESEIFRILENANAQDFPPNDLNEILNNAVVKDKLLKVTTFYDKKPINTLEDLKKVYPKEAQEKDLKLVYAISCTLCLEHKLADSLYKDALSNDEENEQQFNQSDAYTTLDPVVCARNFYLKQRQYLWRIVQEIIRISLDPGHVYHLIAVEFVDMLCERGFVGNVIKSLDGLYSWQPIQIDEKCFPDMDIKTFRDFSWRNDGMWAGAILAESELALDTLVLLLYKTASLTIDNFRDLLNIAIGNHFSFPSTANNMIMTNGATSVSHMSAQNSAKRFHLKWITLAISVYQFYRSHAEDPDEQGSEHPFFSEPVNTLRREIIAEISDQMTNVRDDPVGETMKLLWFLFLDMFHPEGHDRKSWNLVIDAAVANGAIETLTILCNNVLPSPSYMKGSTPSSSTDADVDAKCEVLERDCEFQNIYFILQDCVNALIPKFCNAATNFSGIDLISQLVDMTYRGDELLCTSFWYAWVTVSSAPHANAYPLCRLLVEVSNATWLESLYMIRIVNAVTCFTENSVEEIILLLMRPVPLITTVKASQVHVFQKEFKEFVEWEDWFHHLESHKSKHQPVKSKRMEWNSIDVSLQRRPPSQEFDELSALASPIVGSNGSVRMVSPNPEDITNENCHAVMMTVHWRDSNIEWFSSLVSILNEATTNASFDKYNRDALYRIISSLTLFANLISQIPIHKLSEIWEEVCVKMFFRKHIPSHADLCYILLRTKMKDDVNQGNKIVEVSVVDYMKTHQQGLYESFSRSGIEERVAYEVACQFPTIYCPDFVEVIANISVKLMVSLMRCKVALPVGRSGFDDLNVSVEHAIWQPLLQKSLYLLQCVVETSTSPAVALHILSKVTRHYELSGPNSWMATLFRVSSVAEGVTGKYIVTNQTCNLLQSLFLKLHTPMPPDSRDLYKLFCHFDHDSNGGIDREELRQGLNNYGGYTISASAVNAVFQKIDEDNSGTVEFSELLQYASRTTLEDVEACYGDSNSDMYKAETMLLALLRDLTCPGGGVGVEMSSAVACSTVEYCIGCLSHLDKWKHSINMASRWTLTLSCLTVLYEILSRSSPAQCEPVKSAGTVTAWNYFLQKFVTEKSLQTSLMQLCLLQGLTALQTSYTSSFGDVPRSFKAILSSTSQSARDLTAHDVLPLNFSRGYYEVADLFEKQLVEKISLKSLGIYSLLVDSYVYCTNNMPTIPQHIASMTHPSLIILDCFEQFITHMFSNASSLTTLPVSSSHERSFPSGSAGSQLNEFPCSYFTVMFSFVDFPKRASGLPRARSELPRAVLAFVVKLLAAMKAHNAKRIELPLLASAVRSDPYSFLTGVGISNMASLCASLCTSLRLETHLDFSILDFFMHLCAYEPLSLVQLFNVPNPNEASVLKDKDSKKASHLIDPKDSYLVQTIEEMLKSEAEVSRLGSSETDIKRPGQLFKLLQLILTMMDQTEHKSIGSVMLYLCKKKSFWDHITLPLMINIPDLEPNPRKKESQGHVIWEISHDDTKLHALRLMCHSTSLRILARARFGLLFFIDEREKMSNKRVYDSAEAAEDLLDKFFDEKSHQNRFLSWVEFYTRVDVDSHMHNIACELSGRVGVSLETFMSSAFVSQYQPYYARIQVSRFGEHYLYDINVIEDMTKYAAGLCGEDEEYKKRFEMKNAGEDWDNLADATRKLNLMWTIADAQTDLLKSWKEFIETFIKIPPNRPSNYERSHVRKQRDAGMDRQDSIATPRGRGDESPSSKKKSSFKFDRRSYELASEIIRQVAGKKEKDRDKGGKAYGGKTSEGDVAHHFGADVAVEKCDLLVSMLHYQLRDVTHRDADPSSSRIAPRENIRFDKKKMEGMLQSLEVSFLRLTEGLHIRPPSYTQIPEFADSTAHWKQYKDKIMLRLLSAKLMLLQALSQSQQAQRHPDFAPKEARADDFSLCIDDSVCLQTFGNIQTALNASIHDATSFSTDATINNKFGLPLPEKIILTSLRLFNYIAPRNNALSAESFSEWRDAIKSSDIGLSLVRIFRNVCAKNIIHVEEQHDYSKWTERWNGRLMGGAFEIEIKGVSDSQQNKRARNSSSPLSAARSDAMWATLNSVLDTFLAEGLHDGSLLFTSLLESDLLVEICQAPVLLALQRTLCKKSGLTAGQTAAYMSYDAATGEPSILVSAWSKVVQIMQCALRVSSDSTNLYQSQIKAFISTFHPLLFLPLPGRITHSANHQQQSHYYSIQQLRLSNVVMLLFKDCLKYFTTWKVLQADVHKLLMKKTSDTISSVSLVVGDNDRSECNPKVLSNAFVVISRMEHDEANEKNPELSRMRERGSTFDSPPSKERDHCNTPPQSGSGHPGTPGSSVGESFFGGRSGGGSCSRTSVSRNRDRDKQHNLSNFFIDAAWAMFAVMNPCMALLRSSINFSEICGEEYEIDYGRGGLRLPKNECELPVGSQTYYMPPFVRPNQPFTQGIIIKVNYDRNTYNIQASSGLVDVDVSCTAVAFFVKPVVPFAPLASLSGDIAAESRVATSSHFGSLHPGSDIRRSDDNIESNTDLNICTTAHLLRLLTCIRKWSSKWSDLEVFEHEKGLSMNMYVDLSVLCGQLVWLLVVNMAHHSCCATDEVYAGIGDQLDEVRELIKKCDSELELEERADAFLTDPNDNWDAIRSWFERMYLRIMYRSGGNAWANMVEAVEEEEVEEERLLLPAVKPVRVARKPGVSEYLRRGAPFN